MIARLLIDMGVSNEYNESLGKVIITSNDTFLYLFGIIFISIGIPLLGQSCLFATIITCIGVMLFTVRNKIIINRTDKTIVQKSSLFRFIAYSRTNFNLDDYRAVVCNSEISYGEYGSILWSNELRGPEEAFKVPGYGSDYLETRNQGLKLAEFLEMEFKDIPYENCPKCKAVFNIENPEAIICPNCKTSLMMDGEGKLMIEN